MSHPFEHLRLEGVITKDSRGIVLSVDPSIVGDVIVDAPSLRDDVRGWLEEAGLPPLPVLVLCGLTVSSLDVIGLPNSGVVVSTR